MTTSQSPHSNSPRRRSRPEAWLIAAWAFAAIVLAATTPALAKDYYVSPSGDDVKAGTVQQPWKTLNKLNGFSFQPGDNIYFERGGIWREPLVVPTSGAMDRYISYGAYPDDDALPRPVISCARNISGVLWEGILSNGSFRDSSPTETCPASIPGWSIKSSSGHRCAIEGSSTGNALKLTNLGGNTDALSKKFNLKAGRRYVLEGRLKTRNSVTHLYLYSGAPTHRYLEVAADGRGTWKSNKGKSAGATHTASSADWQRFHIPFTADFEAIARLRISVRKKNGVAWVSDLKLIDLEKNYWSATTNNVRNPRILIKNGIRLSKGANANQEARWYIATGSPNVISYIPVNARPEGLIEVGDHRTGLLLDNKSWIRISDLEIHGCEGPLGDSTKAGAGILLANGSSHNILSNILLINNSYGIRTEGKSKTGDFNSHNSFEHIEVAYGMDQGIALRSESSHNVIKDSIVHHINILESDDDGRDKEGISVGGNTGNGPGNIVENNEVYNIGANASGSLAIGVFNSPETIIRGNYVHDIGVLGIAIGTNGKSPHGFMTNKSQIISNTIVRTGISPKAKPGQGITITVSDFGNIRGTRIHDNTIVDCSLHDNKDGGISLRGVANTDGSINSIYDTEIFNNIVSGCNGTYPHALYIGDKRIVDVKGLKSDNNLFFPSPETPKNAAFIRYMGKAYPAGRFRLYSRDSGLDRNSLITDPKFKDRTNDIYDLPSDSPAIKFGAPVRSTGSDAGTP